MKWLRQTFAEWRQWITTNDRSGADGEPRAPYALQIFFRLALTAFIVGAALFTPVAVVASMIAEPAMRWIFGFAAVLALASWFIARRNLR
jgi:hypothetical protein